MPDASVQPHQHAPTPRPGRGGRAVARWLTAMVLGVAAALVVTSVTTGAEPAGHQPVAAGAAGHAAPDRHEHLTTGAYGDDPAQQFDLYLPSSTPAGGAPLIIWMHGGGWVQGDRTQLSPAVQHQIDNGFAVASIDYHLVQQGGTFPVPIVDTKLAVRYFKANAARWHLGPDKILLGGFSAGGYNAAFAALSGPGFYEPASVPPELADVDSSVAGVINEAGPTDFEDFASEGIVAWFDTVEVTTEFLGCPEKLVSSCDPATLRASRVTPLVGPASPPMFLVYGGLDPLVPSANGDLMKAAYTALGLPKSVEIDVIAGYPHTQEMDDGVDLAAFDRWTHAVATSTP